MERAYTINNSEIRIYFGNILDTDAEVIVSSDDCLLSMGGGISRCIMEAAGDALVSDAMKKIPAQLGNIVVTTAGNLRQKFIFHAITINEEAIIEKFLENDGNTDEIYKYIVGQSIRESFRIMAVLDIHSIAFPAIGAGAARIPYESVAQIMSETLAQILSATNKHYDVSIYLYDRFHRIDEWMFLPFFEFFAYESKAAESVNSRENSDDKMPNPDIPIDDKANPNPDEMDHQVFISYSRKDSEAVRPICGILNELNVKYWIDIDGIYSGDNYKEIIGHAIKETDLVLFVSSVNSNSSKNVTKEIGLADKYGKTIIPVRLDNSPYNPKIDYDLNSIDCIDISGGNPEMYEKLRKTVRARLVISCSSTKK